MHQTDHNTSCSDPAIDPGGRLEPPTPSAALLLDLQIRPRVQPYLEDDVTGDFIIDTTVSWFKANDTEFLNLITS